MSKCTIKRNEKNEIQSIELARLDKRFDTNGVQIFNRVVDNIAKRLGLSREEYSKRLGIISAQRSVRETIESITNKTMTNYYNEVDTGLIEDDILFQAPVENNKILDFVEGLDPKEDAGLIKALHASPTFLEAMDSVGSNVNTELRQQLNTAQREIQEYFKNKDGKNPRVAELKKQITELKEKIEQSENLSSRITKEEARRLLESDFQVLYDEATTTDKYLIEEYTEEFILGAIDYERNRANNELLAQGWEQVLKSKREGTEYYEQNLAGRKEEQRANLVANVKGLKTNNDFPIEFKYLMLDAILNYYVNPKGYYARRTNSTVSLHNNLSYKVLPSVYEDYLEDSGTNLLMSYYRNKDKEFLTEEQRREVGEKYIVEETDRGYYLKIPQNGTEADVDALYQLTRESHRHPACWCTGAAVATAKGHNNEGDFYLFVDKEFNVKLAFRYSGGSLVEARGLGEGQLILEGDAQDAKYFYDKYPNAKAYEKHYYFNKYYREHIIEKKPIESKEHLFSLAKVIFAGDGSYTGSYDKEKVLREFVEESIKKDSERLGLKEGEVAFSAKDFTKDTVISLMPVTIKADSDSEYKLEYAPGIYTDYTNLDDSPVTLKFGNIESDDISIDDKIKVVAKSVTAPVIDLSKESTIVSESLSTEFIRLKDGDNHIKTKKANIQNLTVRGYNNIIEGVKYIDNILVEYDMFYRPYHADGEATFIGLEEAGSIEGSKSKIYAPDLKKAGKIKIKSGLFEAEKLRQVNSDFTTEDAIVFASKLSEVGGEFNTYSTKGNLSSMEPHLFPPDFRYIKGTYSEYLANGIREEKEERNRFETLNQDERGAIIKFPLSSIIVLGKNADDTTPLHEIAHEYERVLTDSERNKVLDWAGHKEWTRETSEAFAKGFERYLYEGTEPESIFKQFAEYLKELIEDAIAYFGGIDELNQDMRDIYALMVEQSGEASAQRSFERIAEPVGNNIYSMAYAVESFMVDNNGWLDKQYVIPSYLQRLFDNYSAAIGRTSDYRGRLVEHINRGAGQVYKPFENDSSALVGYYADYWADVFVVSHFAPSSLRSGVRLMNQVLQEDMPFVFAVPSYQANQLEKAGFYYVDTVEQYFNGEMVEKHVYINKDLSDPSNEELRNMMDEYLEGELHYQDSLSESFEREAERITIEKESIRKNAIADGTFMRAPNGNVTNLTEQQWLDVRTKRFKKWFGDWENDPENASKVVDENGEPIVMYHGSKAEFEEFSTQKMNTHGSAHGYGFYFTESKELAEGYAGGNGPFNVYLNIKNPITDKTTFTKKELKAILKAAVQLEIEEHGEDVPDYRNSYLSNIANTTSMSEDEVIEEYIKMFSSEDNAIDQIMDLSNVSGDKGLGGRAAIRALGYDGIYVENFQDKDGRVFLAWDSNQIKSATNNVGTFSGEVKNILYQLAGEKEEPIIQRQESELAKELISLPFLTQEEAVSAFGNIFNEEFDWRESNCR